MSDYGKVISFDEFNQIRDGLGRIVCTSGGFDPLHPGHASCIIEIEAVWGYPRGCGEWRRLSKAQEGQGVQSLETVCHLVSCLRNVDYVIPFEIEGDQTVSEASAPHPAACFTKGGDRLDFSTVPEWQVCEELGIELVSRVGKPKLWSSSSGPAALARRSAKDQMYPGDMGSCAFDEAGAEGWAHNA